MQQSAQTRSSPRLSSLLRPLARTSCTFLYERRLLARIDACVLFALSRVQNQDELEELVRHIQGMLTVSMRIMHAVSSLVPHSICVCSVRQR